MEDCLIQVKQGHFYLDDRSMVSDILMLDSIPLSFETNAQPISIYLLFGTQKVILSVDNSCKFGDTKRLCIREEVGPPFKKNFYPIKLIVNIVPAN